jgi:hypothetical protein
MQKANMTTLGRTYASAVKHALNYAAKLGAGFIVLDEASVCFGLSLWRDFSEQ